MWVGCCGYMQKNLQAPHELCKAFACCLWDLAEQIWREKSLELVTDHCQDFQVAASLGPLDVVMSSALPSLWVWYGGSWDGVKILKSLIKITPVVFVFTFKPHSFRCFGETVLWKGEAIWSWRWAGTLEAGMHGFQFLLSLWLACYLGQVMISLSLDFIIWKKGDGNSLQDFPGGSVVKNPPASTGDLGSIPGLGRFPGGGNGNPL